MVEENNLKPSEVFSDFIERCQKHYICLSIANSGLKIFSDSFAKAPVTRPDGTMANLIVGPSIEIPIASIKIKDAVDLSKNGDFYNSLAKSTIVLLYNEWDEFYRPKIAKELNVKTKNIKYDLMGDIRLIRNCIVHNKSTINNSLKELKIIKIKLISKDNCIFLTESIVELIFSKIFILKPEITED